MVRLQSSKPEIGEGGIRRVLVDDREAVPRREGLGAADKKKIPASSGTVPSALAKPKPGGAKAETKK